MKSSNVQNLGYKIKRSSVSLIFFVLSCTGCVSHPEVTASNNGIKYAQAGKYEKALAEFDKAIQINPNYAKAYFNRGVLYGKSQKWEKAISDFNKAIELTPKTTYYVNLAIAYGKKGDAANAIVNSSKALQIDPGNMKAFNIRGVAHSRIGDLERAVFDYNEAIKIAPKVSLSYINSLLKNPSQNVIK